MSELKVGPTRRAGLLSLIDEVAAEFGVRTAVVIGPLRGGRRIVAARQVSIGLLLRHPTIWGGMPATQKRIGLLFGRDHSTIHHAIRRYDSWCQALGLDPADTSAPLERARDVRAFLGYPPPPLLSEDPEPLPASSSEAEADPEPIAPPPPPEPLPLPDPLPEPSMTVLPVSLPPLISGDLLFGPMDPEALAVLSPTERREAMALLEDKIAAEDPRLSHSAVLARIGNAFGLHARDVEAELASPSIRHSPAGLDDEDRPTLLRLTVADAGERMFLAFAQIHLTADPSAAFDVAEAYDQFAAFCRARLETPMPRSNFGASLRQLGGARMGARITGLHLRATAIAAAAE